MTRPELVAVTSRSFSRHPSLRLEMSTAFPNARFNDQAVSLSGDCLAEFLGDCEFAVTALETIDDWVLSRTPNLRCIAKIGVGTDMVDINALDRHGVRLMLAPGGNSNAVAELTLMLMLACLRRLPESLEVVARGEWTQPKGRELQGRTVGIVGYGHVGRAVARVVHGLGCKVVVYEPNVDSLPGVHRESFETLLASSDIVSLHLPLTSHTHHMLGQQEFQMMRKDAILINTSRGGVVDEASLVDALNTGTIAGAALDVLEREPLVAPALLTTGSLLLTPHVGGSTEEAIVKMGRQAIANLVGAPVSARP